MATGVIGSCPFDDAKLLNKYLYLKKPTYLSEVHENIKTIFIIKIQILVICESESYL